MRFLPLLFWPVLSFSLAQAADVTPTQAKSKPAIRKPTKKLTKEQIVDALWNQSDAKFHAGDYLGAVALHRKIVALEPGDVESYSVAAWLLWSLGKSNDAVQFIQQGLKANPKDPEMWDAAGQHFSLQKRASDAENAFGKAIEFTPKGKVDMMLRRRYGHAAQDAGHLAKSIGIWRALVADFPNDAVNRNNLRRVEKAARPNASNAQDVIFSPIRVTVPNAKVWL